MKSAVIKTGGKQYLVQEGSTIKVEKIPTAVGQAVTFTDVLLTSTDQAATVGTPTVSSAKVEAMVVEQSKSKKTIAVKMKAKKRNRKLFGHRQAFTAIEVTKISTQ